ncbi:MAG: PEGA domain-containing protein [Deltaproteobacteria bacterium]|nr:PEGA domain-containing protein [Deltaproteobacteria bacterium]
MNFAPVLLALTLGVSGAPKTGKWVVLVHIDGEVPSSWPEALRKAAETVRDGRVWTEPPAVTLAEAQAALGCPSWGPACAAQVAKMTGATTALLIDVTSTGAGVGLSAEAVLAANGQPAKGKNEVLLPDTSDDSLRFAAAWVKGALADKLPALLIVETATPGGEVRLDGKRAGTTELGPVRIIVDAPGTHTLLVTKEGAAPVTRELRLTPNETARELITMSAEGPPVAPDVRIGQPDVITPKPPLAPQPPPPLDNRGAVVGWSVTGVGGLVALGAGVFTTTVVWNLFYDVAICEDGTGRWCQPVEIKSPLGVYSYRGAARDTFNDVDGPLMITLGSIGVGVGGLLIGTGVWLVLAGAPEPTELAP